MSYGVIICNLSNEDKQIIRHRENIDKKACNTELAINFNTICIREHLLPTYTKNIPGDQAVHRRRKSKNPTPDERIQYMQTRLEQLKGQFSLLKSKADEALSKWNRCNISNELRHTVEVAYSTMMSTYKHAAMAKNQRKLVKLNGGQLKYSNTLKGYINLTQKVLTTDQDELLDMGLNCHVMKPPQKHAKKLECEILIDDIEKLVKRGLINTEPSFKTDITSEASKTRGQCNSKILQKRHIDAAKQLRADPSITIRRADKASSLVIIDTDEYLQKMDSILNDKTKFVKITRDPTEDLKKKVNKLVDNVNAKAGGIKLPRLIGDYGLGYCYGNVKTHKPGNKLRPIISQIPTPTYLVAKKLGEILSPYIPSKYSIQSATDFLDLLQSNNSNGVIASLDVEQLFTNVPVDRTIQYILKRVYHDNSTPECSIPELTLKALLECCTKESPFRCPRGNKYKQIDGVAMGSPLGVLFANFFMGSIEEEVFCQIDKPPIYCRYVDDIFVLGTDNDHISQLKIRLQEASGLNFTIENSTDGSLPFLDVLVKQWNNKFISSVYTKPTNPGHCLNGHSECPQRYKDSTISAYIRRALSHSSRWQDVHTEIERATQVLINNGFRNDEVTRTTKRLIDRWYKDSNNSKPSTGTTIPIYYKAHFSSAYKEDERVMRQIIHKNIKPTDSNNVVKFIIYYQNKKSSDLVLKNNTKAKDSLQTSHIVYKYICNNGNCATHPSVYIGMSSMKLSKRLTYHLSSGAIKDHHRVAHNSKLTRDELTDNTTILATNQDGRRLPILEAIFIKDISPNLNIQANDLQALPSWKRTNGNQASQGASSLIVRAPPGVPSSDV